MNKRIRIAALLITCVSLVRIDAAAQSANSDEQEFLPGRVPYTPGVINLWGVDLIHRDTAFAVGDAGTIKKTPDAGASWATQLHAGGSPNILLGISFLDSTAATAVGTNGTILKTTDAGQSWFSQTSGTTEALFAVSLFTDSLTGVAVGDHGVICRTTDAGATWVKRDSGRAYALLGLSFADANTGTAVGGGGKILHTTDGGVTWTAQSSGVTNFLYAVWFTDANNGTAAGTLGTILHTTNGGANWSPYTWPHPTMNYFYALSFANANDGFAVGNAGTIARTTDAGSTWTLLPPRTANNLYAISVADTNRGIIVGGNGTIIRLTDSGMVATDVRGSALAAPSGFRLEQNYPNPFNPVTKIRFGIGAASSVSLRLYDLLGRQVATLADEELAPGSYERTFDGSKLPSGMYFYRLRAAGHDGRPARVETRKLLLLR